MTIHVVFRIGNCPVCGRDLTDKQATTMTRGHVNADFSMLGDKSLSASRDILYSACDVHIEQGAKSLQQNTQPQPRPGYFGEWEPRLGLLAEVKLFGDDGNLMGGRKTMRLLDPPKQP